MATRGDVDTLASRSNKDKERLMFPSQPQIGQDMAKERQQQAEWIRQAQSAAPEKTPRRSGSVRWRWIDAAIVKRRLAAVTGRLGMSGLK